MPSANRVRPRRQKWPMQSSAASLLGSLTPGTSTSKPLFNLLLYSMHRAEAKQATSGVSFSLVQGYPSREAATKAFDFARRRGWTCDSASWTPTPISAEQAPLPVLEERASRTSLVHRKPEDPWYVVYAGVNPGVFPSRFVSGSFSPELLRC
jgi:hypothetical protein